MLLVLISVQGHDVFKGHFPTPGRHNGYVTSVCFSCHYKRIPLSIGHINFKIHPGQVTGLSQDTHTSLSHLKEI